MDRAEKINRLEELRAEAAKIEAELAAEERTPSWPPRDYYLAYHTLAGMVLGFVGACASLMFNVIGSAIVDQSPFQLIKVYMTFPLGARALEISDGFALAGGCGLYLCTGAIFGVPIHLVLSSWMARSSFVSRFVATTIMGLALWIVNFYVLLSWLQPSLIGGNWILDQIPWWVAAATHVVFAWSLLAVSRWGHFAPYEYQLSGASLSGEMAS